LVLPMLVGDASEEVLPLCGAAPGRNQRQHLSVADQARPSLAELEAPDGAHVPGAAGREIEEDLGVLLRRRSEPGDRGEQQPIEVLIDALALVHVLQARFIGGELDVPPGTDRQIGRSYRRVLGVERIHVGSVRLREARRYGWKEVVATD